MDVHANPLAKDSYAPLNFMLKSMELDQEGKMPRQGLFLEASF